LGKIRLPQWHGTRWKVGNQRYIRSLYRSVRTHAPVTLEQILRRRYPSLQQEIYRPRVTKPKLVHVTPPTA
jgi:hypothetical protein